MSRDPFLHLLAHQERAREVRRGPQAGYTSIAEGEGSLDVEAEDGSIAASFGNQIDGTFGAVAMNGPEPPAPSPPAVEGGPGTLAISWDGGYEAGARRPLDQDFIDVMVSPDPAMDTAVRAGTFVTGGSLTYTTWEAGTYYVALVTETKPGRRSAPSEAVAGTAETTVTDAALEAARTALEAADQELREAGAARDQAIATAAGDLDAAEQRLATAENDLVDAFGAINTTIPANIEAARAAAVTAAKEYADAQLAVEAARTTAAQEDATAALTAAEAAQATADGSIRTFYQAEPPAGLNDTTDLGDLWYDTDNDQAHRWNGAEWSVIQDSTIAVALGKAEDAQSTADGKITSYYRDAIPATGQVGDLWFDTGDDNKPHYCTSAEPVTWAPVRDGEIANAELRAASDALTKANTAEQQAKTYADNQLAPVVTRVSQAETDLREAEGRLDTAETFRTTATTQLEAAETAINETFPTRFQAVETDLAEVPAAIDTKITAAEPGILSAAATTADSKITAAKPGILTEAASTAETKIANAKPGILSEAATATDSKITAAKPGILTEAAAAMDTKINNATPGILEDAKQEATLMVNGVSQLISSTAAPGTNTAPKGSIWRRIDAAGKVLGIWEQTAAGTAATWKTRPIRSEVIDNLDVGKLSALSGSINNLVAQDFAAKTSHLIEANIGKLVVTGDTHLADATAERIAADSGQFLELAVDQLTVPGSAAISDLVAQHFAARTSALIEADIGKLTVTAGATINEAVIEKLFSDVVVGGTVQATEAFVGENAILTGAVTARTVTASEAMTAKMVRANMFEGKSFTGGTFTGSVFQTSAAADSGIKIDFATNALSMWDATGRLMIEADADTGDLDLRGTQSSSAAAENGVGQPIELTLSSGAGVDVDAPWSGTTYSVPGLVWTSSDTTRMLAPPRIYSYSGEGLTIDSGINAANQYASLSMSEGDANLNARNGIGLTSQVGGITLGGLHLQVNTGTTDINGKAYVRGGASEAITFGVDTQNRTIFRNPDTSMFGFANAGGGWSPVTTGDLTIAAVGSPDLTITNPSTGPSIRTTGGGLQIKADAETTINAVAGVGGNSFWGPRLFDNKHNASAGLRTNGSESYFNVDKIYQYTTSGSPNVMVGTGGAFHRTTSARKYKYSIDDLPAGTDDKILSLDAKRWYDKRDTEMVAAYYDAQARGEDPEQLDPDIMPAELRRIPGMIAEDVEAAGLEEFVVYGDDGQPEGLLYDRLAVALIPVTRRLRDRVQAAESKAASLEARLVTLEGKHGIVKPAPGATTGGSSPR